MKVARQLRQSGNSQQPLAIGLKCVLFLIALLLYSKSTIFELTFLDPKGLCLPNQFLRGS